MKKKTLTHEEMSLKGGKSTLKKYGKKHFKKMVKIREEKRLLQKEQTVDSVDNSAGQTTA